MYKQFRKETPQGVISKTEFKEVMKQMGVVDNFLQDLIFNVFDTNKDGTINFQEFVAALSVMTRGTPDEKLECTQPFIFASLLPFSSLLRLLRWPCTRPAGCALRCASLPLVFRASDRLLA